MGIHAALITPLTSMCLYESILLPPPIGKLINFKGFAVGDGFPACIPQPGKPIDWCADFSAINKLT